MTKQLAVGRLSSKPLCIVVAFLAGGFGCGSEESPTKRAQDEAIAALRADTETTRKDRGRQRGPQAAPDTRRQRDGNGAGKDRSRNRARSRKWASQHLYMRLALDHLKLSEEQLTKLSDMNWRHFAADQKMKAARRARQQGAPAAVDGGAD